MNSVIVSMTFPPEMLAKIAQSRGDTSRSRMVEKAYGEEKPKK
jgi:hypothetical protein